MRRLFGILAVLTITLGIARAQDLGKATKADGSTGSVAQALTDLENQWAKASKESNGDALAPLLAGNFVGVDSDGSVRDKAAIVARTKKAKWTTSALSDMRVTQHGDSAIVTGTWMGRAPTPTASRSTPRSAGSTRG